jgi:hypothetical protein
MIPSVLSWDALITPLDDCSGWLAICLADPDMIGHGKTEDEATDDLREQLESI